ncbi:class I SAM-dependent methyltransferase [Paractinoplanes ferrugineus]|uniref:Methyltransferase type 11 n=1 Tax=Paractinoplanes ferrugineus TaxID=113564 RepID=A0A919J2V9_9ACTN|nr:class I SAM-dependent methyltransferase [Actinoplanes ferrugineus]GIE12382.1 methyltransferase type 11 [Actinoplanes ferrugineus]
MPTRGTEPHEQRAAAESFGAEAARYDRARPSYPQDLVRRIVENSPGRRTLDVGCGTGIAARQFQAEQADVLGLDVDARMAEQARTLGLEVEVSKFEDWDPRGRRFDLVVAAQAWHWVDPVAGAAKAAEILAPAGRIALLWNVMEPEPAARAAMAEANVSGFPDIWAGDRPILETYDLMFAKAEDGLDRSERFSGTDRWTATWQLVYTRTDWLDQLPTFGGMSRLPKDELDNFLTRTAAVIPDSFVMHYTTVATTAIKR